MNRQLVAEILMNLPLSPLRAPKNEDDFGDSGTVGLHLKKRGVTDYKERDFGIFLGKTGSETWGVGIKDLMSFRIIDIEEYSSMEELKKE